MDFRGVFLSVGPQNPEKEVRAHCLDGVISIPAAGKARDVNFDGKAQELEEMVPYFLLLWGYFGKPELHVRNQFVIGDAFLPKDKQMARGRIARCNALAARLEWSE